MLEKRPYKIVLLYFLICTGSLYAQNKILKNERLLLINPELQIANPALLQNFKDSILFNANISCNYEKGDFVNYYKATSSYKAAVNTHSYIRLNDKTTVFGLASYYYQRGKNSGGTSFLYPYRTPFNFTPVADSTKGDNRLEQYRLAGAFSYQIIHSLSFGAKIDYQTISFTKLRDMRNINDILQLNLYSGIKYDLSNSNSIGISYRYNRYIENMKIDKYGKSENNYYALLNKGAFMGLLYIYGDDGILDTQFKRPWVDIVHSFGLQYVGSFSETTKLTAYFNYGKGKGHYGNDDDNSVVYMRHDKKSYSTNNQIFIKTKNTTHIVNIAGNYNETNNYEQLYREVTTQQGNSITEYYGKRQSLNRKQLTAQFIYHLLLGREYMSAGWHFTANYTYRLLKRKASYFPYFRKQNIEWHNCGLSIAKEITHNNTNFSVKYSNNFVFGNGGFPIDGMYISSSSDATKPDYLNYLLHKEREYLTAKRLLTGISFRASKPLKSNDIYLEFNTHYTQSFNTKYTKGNYLAVELAIGLAF